MCQYRVSKLYTAGFLLIFLCGHGSLATSRVRRIVNGDELTAHSWPWLASLHFTGPQHAYQQLQDLPHLCGGVLIAPQWVLSAAHCFLSLLGRGLNESSNWQVLLGEHDRQTTEATEQRIPVERIYKHHDLTLNPFGGDVALLKLAYPATLNTYVQTIALDSNPDLPPGARCKVAGWGQVQDASQDASQLGRGSMVPLVVELYHVPTQACRAAYLSAPDPVAIDNRVFCFGSNQGKDSCQGDSGTPLICWRENNTPVVTGILSLGFSCGLSSHPGVYSSVPYYKSDILRIVFQNAQNLMGQQHP